MSAAFAVAAVEWRMRRGEILALVVLTSLAALAVWLAPTSLRALHSPWVQAAAFALFGTLALGRSIEDKALWAGWSGAMPMSGSSHLLGRLVVQLPTAILTSVLYVLVFTDGMGDGWQHAGMVLLWLLLAGLGPGAALLVLGWALPTVVIGSAWWQEPQTALILLAATLMLKLVMTLALDHEWLPRVGPKEIRPRMHVIRRFKKAELPPRSFMSVLRHYRPRGGTILVLAWAWYAIIMQGTMGGRSPAVAGTGSLLVAMILVGSMAGSALRRAQWVWQRVRAYPLRRWRVWGPPLVWPLVALGLVTWAALSHGPLSRTPTLVENRESVIAPTAGYMLGKIPWSRGKEYDEVPIRGREADDHRVGMPFLSCPSWIEGLPILEERPAAMPGPWGGLWPLRRHPFAFQADGELRPASVEGDLHAQWKDEPGYFHEAMRFHLHLVHGVVPTADELDEALGKPTTMVETPGPIPLNDYTEHFDGDGSPWFTYAYRVGGGLVIAEAASAYTGRHPDQPWRVDPPIELYGYTTALAELQTILEPRLVRATRWIYILDAAVLLLCLLLFIRFTLAPGVLRWALPIIPMLLAGVWLSSRGMRGYLFLRDLHLEYVGASLGVLAVIGLLILRSTGRVLARPPTPR